jgi:hypothetical protein
MCVSSHHTQEENEWFFVKKRILFFVHGGLN